MPRRPSSPTRPLSTAPLWACAACVALGAVTCARGSAGPGGAGAGRGASAFSAASVASASGASGASGGPVTASSSSAGDGGGARTADGGAGGASGSAAGSGAGGSGGASASSGNGGGAETILTVTAAPGNVVAGYDVLGAMTAYALPYDETTTTAIGLAFTGAGVGVAVIRSEPSGELRFATWSGTWSPGQGAPMLPVQAGLAITGGPSLAGASTKACCAYQGTDMSFYYAEDDGGSWSPTQEAIDDGSAPSTGPMPPAVTTLADVPIVAFVGADGDLHDQARTGGAWQAAHAHGVAGQVASVTPAIVALTPGTHGAELLIVYGEPAAGALMYTLRTSGTWSPPAPIAGASSNAAVSLAPLAAGGAVLAFQGTDGLLHTTRLSAGAPYAWSAPVAGVQGANPTLASPPAVATGAAGAEAELLYTDTTFTLYEARMIGGAWDAPAPAGAAQGWLAIATGH